MNTLREQASNLQQEIRDKQKQVQELVYLQPGSTLSRLKAEVHPDFTNSCDPINGMPVESFQLKHFRNEGDTKNEVVIRIFKKDSGEFHGTFDILSEKKEKNLVKIYLETNDTLDSLIFESKGFVDSFGNLYETTFGRKE